MHKILFVIFFGWLVMKRFHSLFWGLLFCLAVSAQSDPSGRAFWIDRYLSVSYPLKSIKVNSKYGKRKDPFTGASSHHSGLDLQAHYEEVYSMFNGTVESIGSDSRSGNYIILRHGEYTVSYCHLSKIFVKKGDTLIAGDPVGYTGNSGRSTGPHLHITCKYKGNVTDPYTLLIYIKDVREEAVIALGGSIGNKKNITKRVSDAEQTEFFNKYADAAIEQQQLYGIPASVTLSQMAYESFWGQSTLATTGNNFFGIKCSREWLAAGKPYSLHNDDKPNEKFCNYASVDESIEHHSRLLMGDRYKRCHRFSSTDYHNWLVAIKACGYATAPDYVRKLESMIKRYKLYLFDRIALKT